MKYTILALLVIVTAFASAKSSLNNEFEFLLKGHVPASNSAVLGMYEAFLQKYKGKTFEVNHDMDRFMTFKANVERIIAHNSNPERTFDMGINHLSDLTQKERLAYYNLMDPQNCSATASKRRVYNDEAPDYFNWVDQDVVSPVKDQKSCGSCWTFSTTGAIESHYKINTGEEELFSEQELIDCPDAERYDTHGCKGGLPSYAFNFIKEVGLETENSYPYLARDSVCTYDAEELRVTTDGPFNITAGDEEQLKEELFNNGPVSVSFHVKEDFLDYTSGVYSVSDCPDTEQDVNHAVLAVGYGTTDDGMDYWIVKNSWSEVWGDEGFFKIERGVNMCAIAMCNSYPLNVRKV
mmetsp:Transcript_9465/g.9190  ORF Transcript_9465/g.9190 Transcript_9465/m.9190 type:complete len:351 (-) Transcript_9465:48-1100(-)